MKDKIAIVIGNKLYAYRKGFVDYMSKSYDLTIYCIEDNVKNDRVNLITCKNYSFFGFKFQIEPLRLLKKNDYKKVIVIGNIRCLSNLLLMCFLPKKKVITWGFWNTESIIANRLRAFLSKRASANVLYAKSHLKSLANMSPKANFTIGVNSVEIDNSKLEFKDPTSIVLIGTLNERKKIDIIIKMMPELIKYSEVLKFEIVGDGPCRKALEELVEKLDILDRVIFHGASSDPLFLAKLYSRAIIEVSPGQAGLSVPTALGHSTPFATMFNAISGGETDSIVHGYNGFIANNEGELLAQLISVVKDRALVDKMKENSLRFYNENLTVLNMVSGFEEAINL